MNALAQLQPVRDTLQTLLLHQKLTDETQIFLQDLWQQNIGIPEIGILDDFFDLGGDSLTSIQILSAIQRQYDFRLTTNDFVDNSTIEQLALIIDQQTQLTKSA